MKFLSQEELRRNIRMFLLLAHVCSKNNIKVPKIGIIDDDNPTAFTYGSIPSNARMVFSKGFSLI